MSTLTDLLLALPMGINRNAAARAEGRRLRVGDERAAERERRDASDQTQRRRLLERQLLGLDEAAAERRADMQLRRDREAREGRELDARTRSWEAQAERDRAAAERERATAGYQGRRGTGAGTRAADRDRRFRRVSTQRDDNARQLGAANAQLRTAGIDTMADAATAADSALVSRRDSLGGEDARFADEQRRLEQEGAGTGSRAVPPPTAAQAQALFDAVDREHPEWEEDAVRAEARRRWEQRATTVERY